ncbi:MAG TPA: zinc ribbon domain-containing protein [Solirubrobacteraceae bacterium]
MRFLRKARELAYRDLGGLVYNLHRFGQRNDSLVLAKLATLSRIDAELRGLEAALSERQPVTVLREAGITACPRCAAIHGGEDRFCPNCGLPLSRRSDLPIAGVPAAASPTPPGAHGSTGGQFATGATATAPGGGPGVPAAPNAAAFGAASPPSAPPAPPAPPAEPSHATPLPPTPATSPARAPTPPATETHATLTRDGGGRGSGAPDGGGAPDDDDQPTEIIRPRTSGS